MFPVMDFSIDTSKPKSEPARVHLENRHPPGQKDLSLGNSKNTYWHVCLALALGEQEIVNELTGMIWILRTRIMLARDHK